MSKKRKPRNQWQPLRKGDFYYDPRGLMVFTAQYLKRRGFCCESGCRHCPYGFRKDQCGNSKQEK